MLAGGACDYRDALIRRAREHVDTLCAGRTHGIQAEPTTFGIKLAGFAFEAQRNLRRLERAVEGVSVGALSGAVGTYSANGPEIEAAVLARLGLGREDVSTQVVPRDRHAELLEAIALAGAGLERFATEIRHLQRTEVREAEEPFRTGTQKGSSAMPHKRNPIVCERITGIARLLRGYAQTGLENVALWHERDISHSSAERVALPDATILLDYAQHLAIRVVDGMVVHEDRMLREPRGRPTARSTPSARCWRWWRRVARATTPIESSRRTPSRPGRRARTFASCWVPPRRISTSTRSSIRRLSCATPNDRRAPRSAGLDVCPSRGGYTLSPGGQTAMAPHSGPRPRRSARSARPSRAARSLAAESRGRSAPRRRTTTSTLRSSRARAARSAPSAPTPASPQAQAPPAPSGEQPTPPPPSPPANPLALPLADLCSTPGPSGAPRPSACCGARASGPPRAGPSCWPRSASTRPWSR